MRTIKWGIIGPGNIAEQFAEDLSLVKPASHKVYSILCRNEENGREFKKKFEVNSLHTSIDAFLGDPLDAIYIATPHTLHFEQTLACLGRKIPVLCEKPAAINSAQLREMIERSQKEQTFFMEGMWIRFLPSICKVLELVAGRTIGDIISIKAAMSYKAPYDPDSRYFNPELGGGSLLDLGIYPVFLSTLLLGKASGIKAVGAVSSQGVDEACSILLDYPGKQFATLESSLITETDLVAEINGLKGRIKILSPWNEKPSGIEVEIYNQQKIIYPCHWEGRGFQFEVEAMMKSMEENQIQCSMMPHALSLEVMEVMDEVRRQLNIVYSDYE